LDTPFKDFLRNTSNITKRAMSIDVPEFIKTAYKSTDATFLSKPMDFNPGTMVLFVYNAKWKKILPYYDQHPLIFPIHVEADRFLGINLHYLPISYRAQMMDALLSVAKTPAPKAKLPTTPKANTTTESTIVNTIKTVTKTAVEAAAAIEGDEEPLIADVAETTTETSKAVSAKPQPGDIDEPFPEYLYNDETKLEISYAILKNISKIPFYKSTIHLYLNNHVTSRFLTVPATMWMKAILLPTQRFVGPKKDEVYADSMKKLGKNNSYWRKK
jgi:hypothetical protein